MDNITPQTGHRHYGMVAYDQAGKPICHVCGRSFNALLTHVRHVHKMEPRAYKLTYGLNVTKGILSEKTQSKLKAAVSKNLEVVLENLSRGVRYQEGHQGRTRDKLSEQGRQRLIQYNKERHPKQNPTP
ncbi:hypothetical protein ACP26L_35960 (plasmid) [Paenibacillus sp. S-38]|uniref:hypothetical protein n=1 Tax=Paenibacillus sp. S-38 TaxID=3416710 RepID=UPI003CF9D119